MKRFGTVRLAFRVLAPCLLWVFSVAATKSSAIPDYMEHWEFGLDVGNEQRPLYFLDPILPLYRHPNDERVVFLEPRMRFANNRWLLNLGGGVRQLVLDRRWLLGGNTFFDYTSDHQHYRLGLGSEAISSYAELRSNLYLRLSGDRLVEQETGSQTYERALNGFDMEAGMPVPYYSRLKVFGGFNWYAYDNFKNRYGWTIRTEYKPWPCIVWDLRFTDDTKRNFGWASTVALRIPLGANAERPRSLLALDGQMFPQSDAGTHLFDLVERHHEIVVERRRVTGNMTVQVKRGT